MTKSDHSYVHLPLAVNQERVLLLRELTTLQGMDPHQDHLSIGIALNGPIDFEILKRALNDILQRHTSLSTSIFSNLAVSHNERDARLRAFANTGLFESGMYLQTVVDNVQVPIQVHDLSRKEGSAVDIEIHAVFQQEHSRPFDYRVPPLMRAVVLKLEAYRSLLLIVVDHLVADGWSLELIRSDVAVSYAAFLKGNGALAAPLISCSDFAAWQNDAFKAGNFNNDARYWREQWAEYGSARIGAHHLPFLLPQPKTPHSVFATVRIRFEPDEADRAREFLRRSRISLYALLVAALAIVLRHYTGKKRLAVWAHFSNRTRLELEHTVGFVANTHLLGFTCGDDISCMEFLSHTRAVVMNASMHQEMPLVYLWRVLNCAPRFGDANVLLDVYTRTASPTAVTSPDELHFEHYSLPDTSLPRWSTLGFYIEDNTDELCITSRYSTAMFPADAITRMIEDIKRTALEMIANPDRLVSRFAEVVKDYSGKRNPKPREMKEFVVVGSGLIPQVPQNGPVSLSAQGLAKL